MQSEERSDRCLSWSDLTEFYRLANAFFARQDAPSEDHRFLQALQAHKQADAVFAVLNTGENELLVIDTQTQWQRPVSDLVECLPLLFPGHPLERIAADRLTPLLANIKPAHAVDAAAADRGENGGGDSAVDGALFAFELDENASLMVVLLRLQRPFDDSEYNNLKSVVGLLEQLAQIALVADRGDAINERLRGHHKRESIWLESLAWLNEMGVKEFNREQFHEFYRTAIFQMKLLVSAQHGVAFRLRKSQEELELIAEQRDMAFAEGVRPYLHGE